MTKPKQELVANPPSFDKTQQLLAEVKKNKPESITPLVRDAVRHACSDPDKYRVFVKHYAGGAVTGNKQADCYAASKLLAQWEAEAMRPKLDNMLESQQIRLVDIVKRVPQELRRIRFDVKGSVILGIANDAKAPEGK